MISIAEAARQIISKKPFLEDALGRNIINYNSLAIEMEEEIKRMVSPREVKVSSVSMALRRIGERYKENYDQKIVTKLKNFTGGDTSIKYDLFEITIKISSMLNISKLISSVYSQIDTPKTDFLSIIKGRTEITIITNIKHRDKILKICGYNPINETFDLAALSIKIPEDSLVTPGLFYYFTKALTMEGINISELVSTFSEMQFIIDEDSVNDASGVIRKLVKNTQPFQ